MNSSFRPSEAAKSTVDFYSKRSLDARTALVENIQKQPNWMPRRDIIWIAVKLGIYQVGKPIPENELMCSSGQSNQQE